MRYLFAFTLILFSVISCDSDNDSEKSYDRGEILIQAADVLILPTYENLVAQLALLQSTAQEFIDLPTVTTLQQLQNQHLIARLAWKKAEAFNFGPIDDLALASQMDFWPVNTTGIETEILNYNSEEIESKILPSNIKGLAAIEYLLFQNVAEETLAQFEEDGRKGLLIYYTLDLLKIAKTVLAAWTDDNYYKTFTTSTGQDVTAGATLLANEMIMLAERIQKTRIGRPLGLTSFEDPDPTFVESYFDHKSSELIKANLEMIQKVFNGADGQGFDDYLNSLALNAESEESLATTINAQIENCLTSLELIDMPLQEAIISNPNEVQGLYDELGRLIVLLKSDMMSQLGLTVIFGDSDGD